NLFLFNTDGVPSQGASIKIVQPPSTATKFQVSGISSATAGAPQPFTVTALNADNTVNTGYVGTVHFSSTDPKAILPAEYTFAPTENGVHTFSPGATFM